MRSVGTSLKLGLTAIALLMASNASAAPTASDALKKDIAHARSVDPNAFVNVTSIVGAAQAAHASARSRKAPVAQTLARLGPVATLPLLEKLTGAAPAPPVIVRRDMIEAVGLLADARAVPVLSAILADGSEDVETTRTTAEALARIGTDEAATRILGSLSAANADRSRAIVAGMGELRRVRITEALASRVKSGDDAMVRAAARSLGRAGNAWAWKTVPDHTDEAKIRETAARALVDAFVHHEGEARTAASNALMVVDAAITPSLIAEARASATPETQTALDALATRFANNPAR